MKGITEWDTADGVHILRLHYSADPDKDPDTPKGAEWLKRELVGYAGGLNDPKWRKEMEIDFEAFSGQLLFPFLMSYENLICVNPFELPHTWPLTAGFDYGARNPSAFYVTAWDNDGNPWTIFETYEPPRTKKESDEQFRQRKNYTVMAEAIKACKYFKRIQNESVITADPSIFSKTQQVRTNTGVELRSIADLFAEEGVYFAPAEKANATKDMAFFELLTGQLWKDPAKPQWKIFKTCTWLWRELKSLRFAEYAPAAMETHNQKDEIVDKNNHGWDACKYDIMSNLGIRVERPVAVPDMQQRVVDYVTGKNTSRMPWEEYQDTSGKYIDFD